MKAGLASSNVFLPGHPASFTPVKPYTFSARSLSLSFLDMSLPLCPTTTTTTTLSIGLFVAARTLTYKKLQSVPDEAQEERQPRKVKGTKRWKRRTAVKHRHGSAGHLFHFCCRTTTTTAAAANKSGSS